MSSIVVAGDTSGSITLSAPAVAGSTVLTLPTATGTVTTNTSLAAADANIHGLTVGLGGSSVSVNTAVGTSALAANTTGSYNTSIGINSLQSNTTGVNNTANGVYALNVNLSGSYNTALGASTLQNNTASNNTAVGNSALAANTTAANNTAVGSSAGNAITSGVSNTCLGQGAGTTLTTGSSNIYIGYNTPASGVAVSAEMVIGVNVVGKGSNTGYFQAGGGGVYQGNNSAAWSITSDQRLKKNIVDNNIGLSAINAIQVRNFEYRLPEEVTELEAHSAIDIKGVQLGAIAQELQLILPECVKTESTGVMSVDATNLTWYLINAVKELSAELDALKLKVGAV